MARIPSLSALVQRPRRSHGIGAILLTLVVAFALLAIVELTRTWFNAMHIADELVPIHHHAKEIQRDTSEITKLYKTSALTGQIRKQTDPLEGEADQVRRSAASIDAHAQNIQATAVAIRTGVGQIDATAADINSTVVSLLGTVRSITADARSIDHHASGIQNSFAELDRVVDHIHDGPMPYGVQNTDRNADQAITVIRGIHADLGNVLTIVNHVDQQATSICRAPLIHAC